MNNVFALKILDKLAGVFRLFSVDYKSMRLILSFKLAMDKRRVPTIMQDSIQKENPMISPFVKSLLIYALYGLFLIPFIVMGENYLFQMSLVFGIIMFILMTSMISDFSTVLLDIRDKVILDTKPIDQKTISVAKFMHVLIYMTQLTGAFLLIPFLIGLISNGILFGLIFLFSIIFISFFVIVLTALFYIAVLRFFDGERLRNLINSIQIFLTIGMIVGYQLLAQSFNLINLSFSIHFEWWQVFLPPFWFASLFELLLQGNDANFIMFFSILAVIVPLLALVLYFKQTPAFERNLQKLMESSKAKKPKRRLIQNFLSRVACKSRQEQAFFQFASQMFKQEREFKLKIYPVLGLSVFFPFFMIFLTREPDMAQTLPHIYLYAYFVILMVPTVVHMLKYSSHFKAKWVYHVLPVSDQTIDYRATLKAFLFQLFLPVTVVLSLAFSAVYGLNYFIHFVVIALTGWLFTAVCYQFLNKQRFPFSESFSMVQSTNNAFMIVAMFLVGVFALVHYLIQLIPYGILGYILLLMFCNWIVWKAIFKRKQTNK